MAIDEPIGTRASDGVSDLTLISNIDERGINENLRIRYEKQQIYTYAGSILIAVNPYEEVDIYESEWQQKYCNQRLGDLEPHVFAIAESSYRRLISDGVDQAIVISGESGAGKTESTKFILQYLCSVTSSQSSWVEHQILEANTILEAFGNAKTARNDNSSRFGKFIQVCFDDRAQIGGCVVRDYLLERSRIALQSSNERNYHVFYQLVAAAKRDQELAKRLQLHDPSEPEFVYLNQSGCNVIDGVDDAANFDSLRLAMSVLRVPEQMSDGIFAALSAILWLGNLEFEEQPESERCRLSESDELIISTIATLLGVDAYRLTLSTLRRQISVRGTVTDIPLTLKEARVNRHAMAMALYSRTFSWLVGHINACTLPDLSANRFIGVLDIFGFENFSINSFEQLCINYANEKLQRFFNHYVFALEQQIYNDEGICFEQIAFTDNTACVELLEKPPKCILRLLSEECKVPRGSDTSFVQKLHSEFGGSGSGPVTTPSGPNGQNHPYYVKGEDCRKWHAEFGIRHYAGDVIYQVEDFLAKNKDVQQDSLFEIMHDSTNEFVRVIASSQDTTESIYGTIGRADGKGTKSRPLVADAFRCQLQSLVDLLSTTRPWYVRCIKPNLTKSPRSYDIAQVHTQLRYLGMLDIIRIRREGFPAHFTFAIFVARFRCLMLNHRSHHFKPTAQSVRELLNKIRIESALWQIGHSKIFLKAIAADELEERRSAIRERAATKIQALWRRITVKRRFELFKKSSITIQRFYRSTRQRLQFQRQRRAAITIQAFVRGMFAREVARALKNMRKMEAEQALKQQLAEEEARRAASVSANPSDGAQETEDTDDEVCHLSSVQNDQGLQNLVCISKRSSTPDELDQLEKQLQVDVEKLYGTESNGMVNGAGTPKSVRKKSLPPPPPPKPMRGPLATQIAPNYEEIDNFAIAHKDDNNNSEEIEPAKSQTNAKINPPSISSQFEQLIQKTELAANLLDQIEVNNQHESGDVLTDTSVPLPPPPPPAQLTASEGVKMSATPKKQPSRLSSSTSISLADKLKAIINIEENEPMLTNGNDHHETASSSGTTSGVETNSVSNYSLDSASVSGDSNMNGSESVCTLSSASDTLMLATMNSDYSKSVEHQLMDADRSSIASSILDQRTSTSDNTAGTSRDDCLSVMSGVTGTSADFEAVNASPVTGQLVHRPHMTLATSQQSMLSVASGHQMAQNYANIYGTAPNPMLQNSAALTQQHVQQQQQQQAQQSLYGQTMAPNSAQSLTSMIQHPSKFISKQIEAQLGSSAPQNGDLDGPLQDKIFELEEFVARYCNSHPRDSYPSSTVFGGATASGGMGTLNHKGTLTKKNKEKAKVESDDKFLSPNEMISWTSAAAIPTSHVHLHDPQNVVLSCAIFKELVKYICGEKKPEIEVRFIQTVIGHGIEREELRDEIFLQLVRLSNDNPTKEQSVRCWSLLALATAAFMPGKGFNRYLLTYLRRHLRAHTSIACYAQFCLDNLHVGRLSARRYPPSIAEVKAVTALKSLVCRFSLLDGRTKALDLHPADTASDAVIALANKLSLRNVDGWAIFEVTNEGERVLKAHDYVADVLTVWELRARSENAAANAAANAASNSKTQTATNGAQNVTEPPSNARFVFKKRLFRNTGEIPRDPVDVGLLFAQAVHSVVKLDEFPVSERIALQLAGLQAQVSLGNFAPGRVRSYEDVENYISTRIRKGAAHPALEWAAKIADAHRLYGTNKAPLVAKVWYLSLVMQYPLYGAALFPAQYKGFLAVFGNSTLLLGIHSAAIFVVAASDKRVLATYKYSEIETLSIYPAESLLTIKLFKEIDGSHKMLTFETPQKEEIAYLVAAYSPNHATGWNFASAGWSGAGVADILSNPAVSRGPRRLLKMTLEDRLRLHAEVINSRRALVQANIMRKPVAESTTKWRSTLRKFGRNNQAKKSLKGMTGGTIDLQNGFDDNDYSKDDILRNYPRSFWAYIKEPLISSLLVISDPDLEGSAVTMFEQILYYSGLRSLNDATSDTTEEAEWSSMQARSNSEQNQVKQAQAILEKCIGGDADILRNEFFLQCIMQTTDHPEPNSRVNIRHWQLLALACSLTQPTDRRILAYLMAHLRRCALDQVTREGQYAQFALRNLQGTLETRVRRFAPSRPEIAATIQCRRVYARVHFLDGHFQAVEFDACAVIAEVLEQIQLKIELRQGAPGYALYQILGPNGGEQALQAEDKVGDAIAFWERWHDQNMSRFTANRANQPEPVHYFVFKKHIQIDSYIDLTDSVERELLYHQTLHNVRNDRFPLTEQEAMLLVAIRAQLEFGDADQRPHSSSSDSSSTSSTVDDNAYMQLLAKTMPERIAMRIPIPELRSQHQIQAGMDANQAKSAFFNLIQSWPFHRATVFEVLQTYTSAWPKTLWLAIDQSGMHLLQPRSRNVLCSCEYKNVVDYTATNNSLMIVATNMLTTPSKTMKYIFITHQALQIAQLLRDYTSAVLNASGARNGNSSAPKSILNRANGLKAGANGGGPTTRRKSVEFDLALRNTTVSERQSKPMPFASMLQNVGGAGPIPQPRKSLMFANQTLDPQSLYGMTTGPPIPQPQQAPPPQFVGAQQQLNSAQLYQNQAQLQYQILQHHLQQQQMHAILQQGGPLVPGTGAATSIPGMNNATGSNNVQQQLHQVQAANQIIQNQLAQQQQGLQQRKPRPLVRHSDNDHV